MNITFCLHQGAVSFHPYSYTFLLDPSTWMSCGYLNRFPSHGLHHCPETITQPASPSWTSLVTAAFHLVIPQVYQVHVQNRRHYHSLCHMYMLPLPCTHSQFIVILQSLQPLKPKTRESSSTPPVPSKFIGSGHQGLQNPPPKSQICSFSSSSLT